MEVIQDLPEDVVGIAAKGKITHGDYQKVVIPAIENKLKAHKKIKMLFIMGDFEGMELQALWDDTAFGLKHWSDFTHLALVTDEEWIKNMTAFFDMIMRLKPASSKGTYLKGIAISTTMGPGLKIDSALIKDLLK